MDGLVGLLVGTWFVEPYRCLTPWLRANHVCMRVIGVRECNGLGFFFHRSPAQVGVVSCRVVARLTLYTRVCDTGDMSRRSRVVCYRHQGHTVFCTRTTIEHVPVVVVVTCTCCTLFKSTRLVGIHATHADYHRSCMLSLCRSYVVLRQHVQHVHVYIS
jgi:hypothetical protein